MSTSRLWRRWGLARRGAALATAALAAALVAALLPARAAHRCSTAFPRAQPARLAHLLADFSTHPLPLRGAWLVREEAGNYTSWRYSVCGPRCSGRAAVEAHDEASAQPRHGPTARAHRVVFRNMYCSRLPFLSWPYFCGETEIATDVVSDGAGGAVLAETAETRCASKLAALALPAELGCGDARVLRELRDEHLRRLRLRLTETETR